MKIRRAIVFFVLTLGMVVLVSCQGSSSKDRLRSWVTSSEKVKVLSTTSIINDIVSEIGGDRILNIALMTGEIDPHSYELVKGDNEKIAFADVVFYNGLDLEHGASLKTCLEKHPNSIALANEVFKENQERLIEIDHQYDPHFWMDIELFSRVIEPIVSELSNLDPSHAKEFVENGKRLKARMLKIDRSIKSLMGSIPLEKRYLVSSHDAFFYFARAYLNHQNDWKTRVASPEGLAPDGQMSLSDIQKIIKYTIDHHIKVVFPESNLSKEALKKVVVALKYKGLDAKMADATLYGDTMGEKGSGADSYLKMMEHNARVIKQNLEEAG